jgi:hypothetical protein
MVLAGNPKPALAIIYMEKKMETSLILFILACGASCLNMAYGKVDANSAQIDPNKLADAIFKAEGSYKAEFLYGIRSVKYKDEADARRICLNTINNNKKRFLKQDKYEDYLEFLSSKYAPVGAENDPKNLNKNWLRLVRYFLEKQK